MVWWEDGWAGSWVDLLLNVCIFSSFLVLFSFSFDDIFLSFYVEILAFYTSNVSIVSFNVFIIKIYDFKKKTTVKMH